MAVNEMSKALKVIKTVLITILCIPFVLILLFIGYEILEIIVNDISAEKQTTELENSISAQENVQILDSYTYTGNTSGLGNHVDMLSLILVKGEIALNEDYEVYDCSEMTDERLSDEFYCYLEYPENMENCYIVAMNNSAPFSDNIIGH